MTDVLVLLKSKKAEDRMKAIPLLRRLPQEEREAALLATLDDRLNYIATLAAQSLAASAETSACPKMLAKFESLMEDGIKRDPGCHIRANLAFAFGRLEYGQAEDALRTGIRAVQIEGVGGKPFDTAAHLRANSALGLAQIRARDAVRDISILLFDTGGTPGQFFDPDALQVKMETRKAAAQALWRTGDVAARIPLAIRLTYPKGELPEVLQECMQAVVELEDPRVLELLTPYLKNDDERLAAYAALMIARTQHESAPSLLRNAIQDFHELDTIGAVLFALTSLRSEAGFTLLYELAQERREIVRLASVDVLASLPYPESREILERMAKSDSAAKVRAAAKNALD